MALTLQVRDSHRLLPADDVSRELGAGALTIGRLLAIPLALRFRPRIILFVDLIGCLASVGLVLLWPDSVMAIWIGTLGLGLFMAAIFTKVAPTGIMDDFMALPVTIFYWSRFPQEIFHEKAASTIIVLLIILLTMNAFAIVIRNRSEKKRDW